MIDRAVRKQPLQEVDRLVDIAEDGVNAGEIILGDDVVRVDGERACGPVSRPCRIAEMGKRQRAAMGRT